MTYWQWIVLAVIVAMFFMATLAATIFVVKRIMKGVKTDDFY
jgi:hypothetical protein|tara:strand:+ start:451 stop:576 length:126 start_codon:yes stop_codon:yes gene_type:complete